MITPTSDSDQAGRISSLERRVSDLEERCRSPQAWRAWLRSVLRWSATTPPLLLVLLVGVDRLSSATSLPLGLLLLAIWASAVVLWAAVEVLAGSHLRFRVTRLIAVVALIGVALGYWRFAVYDPYVAEQACLASLKGIKGSVHKEAVGPAWLRGLVGDTHLGRVVQMELAGPEADNRQISRLRGLPHLNCLFLTGSSFDDDSIDDLASLPALEQVYLDDSRVTAAGVARFHRVRPGVGIVRQGKIVDPEPPAFR
jgi:hypothetical protein